MAIEIKVPVVGESISEVTLVKWIKKDGEYADRDEVIAELESEKATFEITAEQAGVIKIVAQENDTLKIGDVICSIDTDAPKPAGAPEKPAATQQATGNQQQANTQPVANNPKPVTAQPVADLKATPVAAAIIADKKVDVKEV